MQIPDLDDGILANLSDPSREAEFLRALAGAYRHVYACALSIVGNRVDTDDVIQEVCVVLWQKYDEYEAGTNFTKWATTITFKTAKAFVRQRRRQRGYGLSDHVLAKVAKVRLAGSELFELRRERLRECLSRLGSREQRFLEDCYRPHRSLVDFARSSRTPIGTIYTRLKRLRHRLTECVHRMMGDEEG